MRVGKIKGILLALSMKRDAYGDYESERIERIESVVRALARESGYIADFYEGGIRKKK